LIDGKFAFTMKMSSKVGRVGGLAILFLLSLTMIATASAYASESSQSWREQMLGSPSPGIGCYQVNYPSTSWQQINCVQPPTNVTYNMGDGSYSKIGYSGSSYYVGSAEGGVSSMTGYSSETDTCGGTCYGNNYYSIQTNTNLFTTTYLTHSTQAWFQFVWSNHPDAPYTGWGDVVMELWLLGWYNTYGSCPSGSPGTDINNWQIVYDGPNGAGYDCTALTYVSVTAEDDPGALPNLGTYASVESPSGDTYNEFCDSSSCWSMTVPDILSVHSYWNHVDWNVYGFCCGDQATFSGTGSSGTDWLTNVDVWSTSGTQIAMTVLTQVPQTLESNNLNYYLPYGGTGYYQFYECQTTPC
jgi:hypothetical protein